MMKKFTTFLFIVWAASFAGFVMASSGQDDLPKAPINLQDRASLQRGAQLFVNNCLGCHSMKYLRYERMAEDLGIPQKIVEEQMMFTAEKIGEPMLSPLGKEQAAKWFGVVPPDLTLEARLRGADWVYAYLTGFYPDNKRPWGVNNHVFPDVGMPHVLEKMEAEMGQEAFHHAMGDLTNFLEYAAEPMAMDRERIGVYVLIFLAILFIPIYFLDKEYWKDVHKPHE